MNQFAGLTLDSIVDAADEQGYRPTGALFPLNSYENRVYEITLEDNSSIIGKFYRPGRWSLETLCDEHRFIAALDDVEFPVIVPLPLNKPVPEINSIGKINEFYYTFYPKFRGRENDELNNDDRQWLGRLIARLHNVGEHFQAPHRLKINIENYGIAGLTSILSQDYLPDDLRQNVEQSIQQAINLLEPFFQQEIDAFPLHGDCHLGNILWNQTGPHLLDFDDMVIAPPVQDIWMLFNGDAEEVRLQQEAFFEGYTMFRNFDMNTFILTEPLRTLRMIHHAAWIGNRYEEETFKRAFPYYNEHAYWEKFLLGIKEQIALLQEPVIS